MTVLRYGAIEDDSELRIGCAARRTLRRPKRSRRRDVANQLRSLLRHNLAMGFEVLIRGRDDLISGLGAARVDWLGKRRIQFGALVDTG